jgi:hypothetical protein
MATPAPAVPGHIQPTHISVTFTIVTPDQLRKIIFKLTKSMDTADDSWSVSFELDERTDATKDFNMVIQLEVDVDHNDTVKASATMKNGLDTDQHAQALAAGDTAKTAAAAPADPQAQQDAKDDSKAVVTARNPASPS